MKATPIAQYLEQKSRRGTIEWPTQTREAVGANTRPAVAAYASQAATAAVFRRSSALSVAEPAAMMEPEAQETSMEPPPSRKGAALFRPREAPPPIDIEAKMAEAYHRGVQEGLDAARAEAATARAMERAELQKRAVVERLDFQMNEYAKVADLIANGLAEIERRTSDAVARILRPFLKDAVANQAVAELAEQIGKLRVAGRPSLMRIRGPERLLQALRARLTSLAVEVEYVEEDGVEVTVEADHTTISSEIAAWTDLIESLADNG